FFDVGQGDAALISTPDGKNILIDAGSFRGATVEESEEGVHITEFDAAEKVIIPYLKKNNIARLDALIITHPHVDHFGGALKILDDTSIDVGLYVDNGLAVSNPFYLDMLDKVHRRQIKYWTPKPGDVLPVSDNDFSVKFLLPQMPFDARDSSAVNNSSLVARLRYKSFTALFTGDIETAAELELLGWNTDLRSTVLKVPHHGSQTSATLPFLEVVAPSAAVISCGRANPYGHPHETVIERLSRQGVKILRTDESGAIIFQTDGKKYVHGAIKR
ncbi:MAG: ComEC/Rec2 family competence protein, partial [Endomicrobiia bacterium]|nr:ComEC/Rec2 family competence protein [Endomicrobiia bacterium]